MCTGAVYPAAGALDKDKGRMLSKPFGPATAWHITYSSTGVTVVVATAQGSYQVKTLCNILHPLMVGQTACSKAGQAQSQPSA